MTDRAGNPLTAKGRTRGWRKENWGRGDYLLGFLSADVKRPVVHQRGRDGQEGLAPAQAGRLSRDVHQGGLSAGAAPQTQNLRTRVEQGRDTGNRGVSQAEAGRGAGALWSLPCTRRWTSSLTGDPRVAAPGVSAPWTNDRVAQQGAEQGLEPRAQRSWDKSTGGPSAASGLRPVGMVAGARPWPPLPMVGDPAGWPHTQASVLGASVRLRGQQLLLLQRVPGTHSPHWPDACFTPCWVAQHLGTRYSPAQPGQ